MLLAYAQMKNLRKLRTGDLVEPLRLTQEQELELYRRMLRGGLIARVRPGLFLVPTRLPLSGTWSPTEAEALNALMDDAKASYQICGPNAFNRYGLDEQIPNRVYVYNNRISGDRRVGTAEFTLIKVATKRLGNTETATMPDGQEMVYASRVRTLVDAVYDWSRFNSLPRGYDWIRQELKAKRVSAKDLVDCTLRYGNTGTIRRMGALLEQEATPKSQLLKLRGALKPTSALIPWIPTKPSRGTVCKSWGILVNDGE